MSAPRDSFYSLPTNLPVPQDDGGADHLTGAVLPPLALSATRSPATRLSTLTHSPSVIFIYPRTGRPDEPAPENWDQIPGARGCTPQSCSFRDLHDEFRALGVQVWGLSTQTTEYQRELVSRIHLPYEILSDAECLLTDALRLPTFTFNGQRLLKRMAWYCEFGKIQKVFYPVFPTDQNAATVLAWTKNHLATRKSPTPVRIDIDGEHYLSDITPADKPAYVRLMTDQEIYDHTLAVPYPYTEADADWWINHVTERTHRHGRSTNWAIRGANGALIGGLGFLDLEPNAFKSEVGYWLAKPYWGRGLMTRAVQKVVDYGFREHGLSRITASVFEFNARSARVLEKCGFQLEGHLKRHYRKKDRIFDGKLFAITRESSS